MKPSSDAVSVKQVTNVLWQYLVGFSFVCVLRSRNVQHRFPLQEASWLKDVHNFVIGQVCPLLGVPGSSVDNNTLTGALVSISELVSHQQLACVSCLYWNTNEQRAWAKEAELSMPGSKALPRVNLLLVGCLTEGRGGEWRLTDSSGSVRCEFLSPSPNWLSRIVFLPHWNYIPPDASGQEETPGCLEVVASPVLLFPEQRSVVSAEEEAELRPIRVREAAGLLAKGQRLSLWGQVSSVSPLLDIGGTTFFCFTLSEETHAQQIKDELLWWSQCVGVGQSVCVTSLRVCDLRSWRGKNILCVTEKSQIHTNYSPPHTHTELQMDTPTQCDPNPEEVEPERELIQSGGMVTEVVNEGAGLYVIDRTVGLCLAYLPSLRRKLRAGDILHNVHFLYRPCPDFPPSMLCTCLRSSVRVTSFSRVGCTPSDSKCPGDKVLPRLLLEKNMTVSEYLWACHLSSRLVPSMVKNQCVCVLSCKLMDLLWGQRHGQGHRDIYSEMLDQPHSCFLSQYRVHHAVLQYVSVAELVHSLKSHCWSSVCLSSLLPPDGAGLMEPELNARLAWLYSTKSSDSEDKCETEQTHRQRPLLLVGMLELPSHSSKHRHTLQLRDGTAAVACVLTESSEEAEGGCLVCVHHFTMIYIKIGGAEGGCGSKTRHRGGKGKGKATEEEHRTRTRKSCTCVSVVLRVEQKEGVARRPATEGPSEQEVGLVLQFTIRAAVIGPVVSWDQDPKNRAMLENESDVSIYAYVQVVLVFSGVSTRWFPLLHSGCFYRLVAANNKVRTLIVQIQVQLTVMRLTCGFKASLLVLKVNSLVAPSMDQPQLSHGVHTQLSTHSHTLLSPSGVRLTVCDQSGRSLQVYLGLSHTPYPHGLLPGNTLLLSMFQRKLFFFPLILFSFSKLSIRSVLAPPPPVMHLCAWALCRDQKVPVARVKGHVVCVLFLELRWSCSLCGSLYRQVGSWNHLLTVLCVLIRLVIDDGTGEAHVWFSGVLVRSLLQLAENQWEGLQRALRVRGQVRVYARGRSLVCDDDTEDTVVHFLLCVCSKDAVCRPLSLTCRKYTDQKVKRFTRGDRDFMTRMTTPIQLTCLHLDADSELT
uniref:CST complex subunit CTC1 n=1 Tax=Cynoglossus semilaevis TaxID=244447 RepID=A0A3P8V5M4_CYNSE